MKRTHVVFVAVCLLLLSGSLLLRARAAAAPDTDSIRMWDNVIPQPSTQLSVLALASLAITVLRSFPSFSENLRRTAPLVLGVSAQPRTPSPQETRRRSITVAASCTRLPRWRSSAEGSSRS
jgi:hypothetical protein